MRCWRDEFWALLFSPLRSSQLHAFISFAQSHPRLLSAWEKWLLRRRRWRAPVRGSARALRWSVLSWSVTGQRWTFPRWRSRRWSGISGRHRQVRGGWGGVEEETEEEWGLSATSIIIITTTMKCCVWVAWWSKSDRSYLLGFPAGLSISLLICWHVDLAIDLEKVKLVWKPLCSSEEPHKHTAKLTLALLAPDCCQV